MRLSEVRPSAEETQDGQKSAEGIVFRWRSGEGLNSLTQGSTLRCVKTTSGSKKTRKDRLGIPTVKDRLVQQAIHQVLERHYDPHFSRSSYGFRPGRSAHDALRQSAQYVKEGREWAVDIDLEKFFDKINHDRLMQRLSKGIGDKRVLRHGL